MDAEVFLNKGGQRGPQLSVLTPGRYRLNDYLWDVEILDAVEVPAGFVGVVKSNVHADIDLGTLKAAKPQSCDLNRPTRREGGKGGAAHRGARLCRSAASACGRSRFSPDNII